MRTLMRLRLKEDLPSQSRSVQWCVGGIAKLLQVSMNTWATAHLTGGNTPAGTRTCASNQKECRRYPSTLSSAPPPMTTKVTSNISITSMKASLHCVSPCPLNAASQNEKRVHCNSPAVQNSSPPSDARSRESVEEMLCVIWQGCTRAVGEGAMVVGEEP